VVLRMFRADLATVPPLTDRLRRSWRSGYGSVRGATVMVVAAGARASFVDA
jgi:hypothetical protein